MTTLPPFKHKATILYDAAARVLYAQPSGRQDAPDDMRPFTYHWTNLPTGRTGLSTVYCLHAWDFLRLLSCWNSRLPQSWHYAPTA